MAQLKDTIISGSLRVTDTIFSNSLNLSSLTASYAVVTDANKNLISKQFTNANTANTIVLRDGSGNFSAGTITATLSGNASSATQVKVTNLAFPSSGSQIYYPTLAGSTTTGNQDIKDSTHLYLYENTTTSYLNIGSGSSSGGITVHNANGKYIDIVSSAFSANRVLTLPNATGTICLTDGTGASGTWGISINGTATRANYLTCPDTRSTALNPNDLTATTMGLRLDFKQKSITGLAANYSGVLSFRPYSNASDWSGGPAHQLAFDENGLHRRKSTGDTTWSEWSDIFDSRSRTDIGISPNFDNPGFNGFFEVRASSETTGESGTKPFNAFAGILTMKTSDNIAMIQLAGSNAQGWWIRGKQAANITLASVAWQRIVTDEFPSRIWIQGGTAAGSDTNRLTTTSGMPGNMQYNQSRRGTQIYANGIAFADPYNGNSNSDAGWIRHLETTGNSGIFEIAVGDDGNEVIAARQYNTSNEVAREILLLDSAGNTKIPGQIYRAGSAASWYNGRDTAMVRMTSVSSYSPILSTKTTDGTWELGAYNNSGFANELIFTYITDANYTAKSNTISAQVRILPTGGILCGPINISGSNPSCAVTDSSKNVPVYLHASSSGDTGIYSGGYWNGSSAVTNAKWMIHRNSAGTVVVEGNCTGTAGALTAISSNDVASSTATWRYAWFSYNDNSTGRPAYDTTYAYQSSTGTLKVGRISCWPAVGTNLYNEGIRLHASSGSWTTLMLCASDNTGDTGTSTKSWGLFNYDGSIFINKNASNADTHARAYSAGEGWYFWKVFNAVWNDYAECRIAETIEPGYCVTETPNGKMIKTTKRLQPGCKLISDTYGTLMGETNEAKTPIAVAGRVLAYPYRNPIHYQLGAAVCSAPNGTIDIMSREEIMMYPERIVGTVSEIPTYDTWKTGNGDTEVKVNGRIWIYVR